MKDHDDIASRLTSRLRFEHRVLGRGRLAPVTFSARLHTLSGVGQEHEGTIWPIDVGPRPTAGDVGDPAHAHHTADTP